MNTPTLQFAFEPVDNKRLAHFCGPLDENPRQVDTAVEVSVARRGEHFSVQGAQAKLTRQVLQVLYLKANHDIMLKRLQLGLIETRNVFKDVRGIMFSDFLAEDVVLHPLVQIIVTAYEHYEQQKSP